MNSKPSEPGGSVEAGETWHALGVGEVARRLASDLAAGLSRAEADSRLETYGPNTLPEADAPGPLRLLLQQFQSVLIYVLFAAAALSLFLGDMLEFVAILVIAALNAALGFVQEYRAEQALNALKSMSAPTAAVLREGAGLRIPSAGVVPGDVLLLESGDIVAADARLIEDVSLAASEAVLTGESAPVDKNSEAVAAEAELPDRTCMLFQGTQVARGRGRAIVVVTGKSTEMGRIAAHVAGRQREETPLQKELAQAGKYLASAAVLLCFGVFVVGILRGIATDEMLLTSASLAVAAIPEGLPAAATIVLALGVQRMARRHVIVRRLSSVETLGAVTTIFTDKTGTLTRNRMQVESSWSAGDPDALVLAAVLCNNATLEDGDVKMAGDPTEIALLAWARDQGVDVARVQAEHRRLRELPFEAERARMTVIVANNAGGLALVKGAPEVILARTDALADGAHGDHHKQRVLQQSEAMARDGLRVLALAKKHLPPSASGHEDDIESGLTLLGLVGMADPLRDEAADAVAKAVQAGVHVVMLTGDQPATAASIGRQIGLDGDVITGREVSDLDLDQLASEMERANVFARVTSEHKMRIIQASRRLNEVVAMTGDGVNDAPALAAADIGIAMGLGGTDVAREASDMVLTDDNFASIVTAIEEGRAIHANIRRFIHFLLACNAAEIIVIFLALLVTGKAVLTPLQILFVNLLTDGLPALALGVEPVGAAIMQQRPRGRGRGILRVDSLIPILGLGGPVAAASLAAYALGSALDGDGLANHMAFATLVGSQLCVSIVFRSETEPVFRLGRNDWLVAAISGSVLALLAVFYLPPFQDAFDTGPLSGGEWLAIAVLSAAPLLIGEATKLTGVVHRLHLAPDDEG